MYVLDKANGMQRNAIQRKAIFPIYERVNSKGPPPPVFVERLIDCDCNCDIFVSTWELGNLIIYHHAFLIHYPSSFIILPHSLSFLIHYSSLDNWTSTDIKQAEHRTCQAISSHTKQRFHLI